MIVLRTFKEELFPYLSKSKVESVDAVTLKYVFTGRNAWHSTWVQKYSEGCMHTDIESAKNYCEKRRTQGTVFNIEDIPALLFKSKSGCLVVTQINESTPLIDYSPDAVSDDVPDGQEKIDEALSNYICKGAPMIGVALSFNPDSRFWKANVPYYNSAIIVATSDNECEFEKYSKKNLSRRISYSQGSDYLLGWRELEPVIDGKAIVKIAKEFTNKINE